ncbi:procathepsin L-like [Leguminivora glycinivorella]|uniref:procathepsin L-like n=1 Tax=Leguminivora glycinivorella TaxID=1035111 RepID=UPI00200E4FD9|nr:procathepsin L-like [Leguminivora glycinivorella]
MFVPIVLATVCLASSTVLAAFDKPYYDLEDAENLFDAFLQEHNKVYTRQEYHERLAIFKKSLKSINEQNEKFPDTVFGLNYFADLTPKELQCYRGYKQQNVNLTNVEITEGLDAPEAFDWRQQNKVTHVKNQQQCGSCFIFSAIGDIEGQHAIKHNQLIALSEQQALDCLNVGTCEGGWMHQVMQELAQRQMKSEKESDYPYKGAKDSSCQYAPNNGVVQCTGGEQKAIMDEEQLKARLANRGPISIAINANDFNYYHHGILIPSQCTGQPVDHAVLLVGYGEEGGQKYWIIKNSWGVGWGEQGYVRMLRGVNACGIGSAVAESTVA